MNILRVLMLVSCLAVSFCEPVLAQHAPGMGYMFPVGGQSGHATEVTIGGYDWTPDMQIFVHDPRITLELIGQPGPIIVPEPPYWFGKKSRRPPFPLPREVKARLTVPAEVEPGLVHWQAANANGATSTGTFLVNAPSGISIVEIDERKEPQKIESLPARVAGQIKLIQEVDQYKVIADTTGPVSCRMTARAIGSPLNAVIEVRDDSGRMVAEAADTSSVDAALTFPATAGEAYVVSIYDLDFRGDRSFVYQLDITSGPRVVTAIPAVGARGETRDVEFVGYGIATGQSKLESLIRQVTFTAPEHATSFAYVLKTEYGDCPSFHLHVSNHPQVAEGTAMLTVPCGVTGVLDERFGEDRYSLSGKKDDLWLIEASGEITGSGMDVSLAVLDNQGKLLKRNDDKAGSTDAELEFLVPEDGSYQICVSDMASQSGSRAAAYYLSVQAAEPDFQITVPQFVNVPIGGKANLAMKVVRRSGFQEAIEVAISGLPEGVTIPESLQVAEKQSALNVEMSVSEDAPASASLIDVSASAVVNGKAVQRRVDPVLVATTIKPPFSIDAEGQDDVTKWPRGTTFPAPVLIERDEGFTGEIMLEMTSMQGRHRQGIAGPELPVAPDVKRILYPVYLPEWLETTRTSRMVVNGVAKVADPRGNIRYSVSKQKTRMGFLPTGALMKLSSRDDVYESRPGEQVHIPITIDRSEDLVEDVCVELRRDEHTATEFVIAETQMMPRDTLHSEYTVTISATAPIGEYPIKLRATLLKDGLWPMISECDVVIVVNEAASASLR